MARTVLVVAAWAWLAFAGPVQGAQQVPCAAQRQLQQHLSASPFFRAMSARYGKPRFCKAELDGERISMTYTFRGGARVAAKVDPTIEYSEERADVRRMDSARAMTLLQEAERYKTPGGCGMQWTNPEEEKAAGTRDVIYRGTTCNCQARLTYKNTYVVALLLRSAC
jgi:hypothetical protein